MTPLRRRLLLAALALVLFAVLAAQGRLPAPLAAGVLLCLVIAWTAVTLLRTVLAGRLQLAEAAWSATPEAEGAGSRGGDDARLTALRFFLQDVREDGRRAEELHLLLEALARRRGAAAEIPEASRLQDPEVLSETVRRIEEM